MLPFTDPIPHRRMAPHERLKLEKALSLTRFGGALTMDPATTAFTGMTLDERDEEQEVIDAIKSTPTHYAYATISDKVESLRRAVQYGIANGKKNVIADLDVLQELFRRSDPLPLRPKPTVEELETLLNSEEKSEIVVQPDGSIKAETFDP